jgi:hypothetical protein
MARLRAKSCTPDDDHQQANLSALRPPPGRGVSRDADRWRKTMSTARIQLRLIALTAHIVAALLA